jgi:hypothetical protein
VGQEHGRECRHPAGVEGAGHHLHRGVEPKTKIKKTTKKNKKNKKNSFFVHSSKEGYARSPVSGKPVKKIESSQPANLIAVVLKEAIVAISIRNVSNQQYEQS